jgi:4-hydroxyphenylacetate 3-monooxygenase
MDICKSGAEHIRSLHDGRTVYIDGELVADVTKHVAFRNSIASAASLYDFQAAPENIERMTFMPAASTAAGRSRTPMPRWWSAAAP